MFKIHPFRNCDSIRRNGVYNKKAFLVVFAPYKEIGRLSQSVCRMYYRLLARNSHFKSHFPIPQPWGGLINYPVNMRIKANFFVWNSRSMIQLNLKCSQLWSTLRVAAASSQGELFVLKLSLNFPGQLLMNCGEDLNENGDGDLG